MPPVPPIAGATYTLSNCKRRTPDANANVNTNANMNRPVGVVILRGDICAGAFRRVKGEANGERMEAGFLDDEFEEAKEEGSIQSLAGGREVEGQ